MADNSNKSVPCLGRVSWTFFALIALINYKIDGAD